MKLGIIGTGNMAEAIIAGIIKAAVLKAGDIFGFDINKSRLQSIHKKYKIKKAKSLEDLAKRSQVILIAVKPQDAGSALTEIKKSITKNHLILSIAAGLSIATIEKKLESKTRVIRAMPNTPALINRGVTGIYANIKTNVSDIRFANKIFSAVGLTLSVNKENLLDSVTGLSGSGPAFVLLFLESLAKGGIACGLKPELAYQLATETILGSTEWLKQSGQKPEELIKKVTSKKGTTLAGLKILKNKKFQSTVVACVKAASQRAKEIKKEMS